MSCAGVGPHGSMEYTYTLWEAVRRAALSERLYRLESPSHHAACSLALLPLSEFPRDPRWDVGQGEQASQCPISPLFPMKRLEN